MTEEQLQSADLQIASPEHQDLRAYAQELAERHASAYPTRTGPFVTADLALYSEMIQAAVQHFREAIDKDVLVSYAAEWLLDNDYLIAQALRIIKESLPHSYSRQLPRFEDGLPRIYHLARALILYRQARLDMEEVRLFIQVYQQTHPLRMGELWALPTLLRLTVIQSQVEALADLTASQERLAAQSLPPMSWPAGISAADVVANGFISLRALAAEDWKDFFECLSLVEAALRRDPHETYALMDFATRDRYRKVVEELALATGKSEEAVAEAAIGLAQGAALAALETQTQRHVGYYLLGAGRAALEAQIGYQPNGRARLRRLALAHPSLVYLGAIFGVMLALLGVAAWYASAVGSGPGAIGLALVLTLIPASSLAIHLVNWLVTHSLPPRVLPKMDYQGGIPPEQAALVVIPSLLVSTKETEALLGQIELHYLRNPDPMLFFALLTDFLDGPAAELPGDADLTAQAQAGVERLNRRYPHPQGGERFFLFHRPRRWNPAEGVWMGWERKRGKLHQLNRLILAANHGRKLAEPPEAAFSVILGQLENTPRLRYVITLDADTLLPPEAARRLVATHAHPLNRPQVGPGGAIVAGYSILQPRTEISPVSANISQFARIFSGDTGLDPYTLAVSDVYQDLFGEGIYVGKGIYDLEAFEASLEGRVPENALLSHDLFEGVHGRTALVTDILLIENYPSHYLVHAGRIHRWIRGDWQLLSWLLPRVPAAGGRRLSNRLSLIDRWKIFDNLRRSLVAPSLVMLLSAAWLGRLPGAALVWTLLAVFSLAGPLFTSAFAGLTHFRRHARPPGAPPIPAALAASLRGALLRWLLALVFLIYEAGLTVNAIAITLTRLWITRRNLLNWTTAAQAERRFGGPRDASLIWGKMGEAPGAAAALVVGCLLLNPAAAWVAAPLLTAWLLSPLVAYRISQPIAVAPAALDPAGRRRLGLLARRTWLFFEQFIGPEDNWLPPDHYQEYPLDVVAHHTSPTNIGLNLLASLGAYDLGYTGLIGLSARLQSSFAALQRLERYRGHFLNWYDTRSLDPLPPSYVSTVDSGNLAACFLALSQGLQALENASPLRWETFEGILAALDLLRDQLERIPALASDENRAELVQSLDELNRQIAALADQPQDWAPFLLYLDADGPHGAAGAANAALAWRTVETRLVALAEANAPALGAETLRQLRLYAQLGRRRMETARRELLLLYPWLALIYAPPPLLTAADAPPPVGAAWERLRQQALARPALGQIATFYAETQRLAADLRAALDGLPSASAEAAARWCGQLSAQLEAGMTAIQTLWGHLQAVIDQAEAFFSEMDFAFLFDSTRQVFHIGYNHALARLDDNYYDLLASEARIASLVAIAKRDVPQSHWLHLARPMTQVDGVRALLSWSATMFEYLMPTLLLRSYENTLLDQSMAAAVEVQMAYGRARQTPWGISESGYYRFDQNQTYQYRAFGVPGLGYKRGLGDDLVITPYASLLALPYRPVAVVENLATLEEYAALGMYGLFEAVDFTPERLPYGTSYEVVREYMAHHQGMIFLALVNYFCPDLFVRRFHADPRIQSVDLLLQEQFPLDAPLEQAHLQDTHNRLPQQSQVVMTPWRARVNAPQPRLHYLTNGRYSVLLTAAGGGYSAWKDTGLTRWRADGTLGDWGQWLYVEDLEQGGLWSVGYLPTGVQPQQRNVYFHPHQVSYTCRHGDISAAMNVTVAPDEDVELRQVELTNHGDQPRRLRLVSYGEVILTSQAADRRHPAFNKLFIHSEWAAGQGALLFQRRARSGQDETFFLGHALVTKEKPLTPPSYESDRRRFIGRGRSTRRPGALTAAGDLSNTAGATLDPIFALAQEVIVPAQASVQVAFLTLVAPTRTEALNLVERFRAWSHIEHTFNRARGEAEMELRRLGLDTPHLVRIQHVLSGLLFPQARLRAPAETLRANRSGQPGLWPFAISGDYPILLVKLNSRDELELAQDALQAHVYWRRRNLKIDLVFLNQQGANYGQELSGQLYRLLARSNSDAWLNQRGGIFLIFADRLSEAERILLDTAARVVLDGRQGNLEKHSLGGERLPVRLPAFIPSLGQSPDQTPPLPRPQDWRFDNGLGGFSPDGREYQLYLQPGASAGLAPAPWSNVIANAEFGFLASEAGLGTTWAANSGENRLTPWSNDPVSEPMGEAVYLRDEETGQVWTPTPLPAGPPLPSLVRHGPGYTEYEHQSYALHQRLRLFVAPDAPVKIIQLRLTNLGPAARRITVTYYAEWVLGVTHEEMNPYIIPDYEAETQTLLARNPYNLEFGPRVAFAAASKRLHGLTGNRTEFLGRLGDWAYPAALGRIGLAGEIQPGKDQCAALQLHIDLPAEGVEEVYFLLGQGEDEAAALALVRRFQDPQAVEAAWAALGQTWQDLLGAVQAHTPDPGMDLLLNGWLLYQTLACRIWGRTAFYQSSGAYGFRDQLQDVMALVYAAPDVARQHILRAAGRQFVEGDVLHWWHPPSGRGVRTRFSDDLLWLPYVTTFYVAATQDTSILDETIPFLKGPLLEPGQEENYGQFSPQGGEGERLYEHCRRAIEKGATRGPHGLPLMGSGDWNDGMNRVGHSGQGESVWLAWFLIDTLRSFAALCEGRGEGAQANVYRARAAEYIQAVERHAWDGDWYRRAYYDDGSPLGSIRNLECQIDSIAQSWAALAGGDPQRARQAMQAVWQRLVRPEEQLALLFAPPFDQTLRDPGYIKGYPPGVRENGGQYTHAATWAAWAFARLGDGEQAAGLFRLLNPIYHASDPAAAAHYRVEPYVIAADVYGAEPHVGLGGWTWYTGSSSWMYRLGLEAILGLRIEGETLWLDPCIPPNWPGFELTYRRGTTVLHVQVENPHGVARGVRQVFMDGAALPERRILFPQDGKLHSIRVVLGQEEARPAGASDAHTV